MIYLISDRLFIQLGQLNMTEVMKKRLSTDNTRRKLEGSYRRYLVSLRDTQMLFNSLLKTLDKNFIKRNVENVCKMPTCTDKCFSIPVCKICFDHVKVDYNQWNCSKVNSRICSKGQGFTRLQTDHVYSFDLVHQFLESYKVEDWSIFV